MSIEQYVMISKATNVVESSCMWDGDTQSWTPPEEYIMLPLSQFSLLVWVPNVGNTDWVLGPMQDPPAGLEIGFLYDGTNNLTTPNAKPVNPPKDMAQPTTAGLQTI